MVPIYLGHKTLSKYQRMTRIGVVSLFKAGLIEVVEVVAWIPNIDLMVSEGKHEYIEYSKGRNMA